MNNSYGRGSDVIIIAAPSGKAQEQSLELVARQGRINFFGGLPKGQDLINFKSNIIHYKHITLTGTTGQSILQYRKAIEMIASKNINVKKLISARFSLEEAEKAFERAKDEDVLNNKWSETLIKHFNLPLDKLPRIVKPWEIVGKVDNKTAANTGLKEGTPIAAGCGDQTANILGAAINKPGMVFDVAGTASVFSIRINMFQI